MHIINFNYQSIFKHIIKIKNEAQYTKRQEWGKWIVFDQFDLFIYFFYTEKRALWITQLLSPHLKVQLEGEVTPNEHISCLISVQTPGYWIAGEAVRQTAIFPRTYNYHLREVNAKRHNEVLLEIILPVSPPERFSKYRGYTSKKTKKSNRNGLSILRWGTCVFHLCHQGDRPVYLDGAFCFLINLRISLDSICCEESGSCREGLGWVASLSQIKTCGWTK